MSWLLFSLKKDIGISSKYFFLLVILFQVFMPFYYYHYCVSEYLRDPFCYQFACWHLSVALCCQFWHQGLFLSFAFTMASSSWIGSMVFGLLGLNWVMAGNVSWELWAWAGYCKKKKYFFFIPLTIFWMCWRKEMRVLFRVLNLIL